jgi:hypothetical protein
MMVLQMVLLAPKKRLVRNREGGERMMVKISMGPVRVDRIIKVVNLIHHTNSSSNKLSLSNGSRTIMALIATTII